MASDDEPADLPGDPGVGSPASGTAEGESNARRVDREEMDPPSGRVERDREGELLHDVEHALEWLQRSRGHLLAFHHAVGHAMDKLAASEPELRDLGHEDLADRVRDELLPVGVTREGAWSYEVVEEFETGPLADVEAFECDLRDRVAGGQRHVAERAQQERWRERAEE